MKKPRLLLGYVVSAFRLGMGIAVAAGRAQTLDAPWFAIDGGGGFSAGGAFSVVGTIGQPDVGVMTGGEFEVSGGFWSAPTGAAPGDCDGDGDVGLVDYACFRDCLTGPGGGLPNGCDRFDFDVDADVDLRNFATFQTSLH